MHDVWQLAQELPGETFAARSKHMLQEFGIIEIYDFHGWAEYVDERVSVLPSYKAYLLKELEQRSCEAWLHSMRAVSAVGPHLLGQHFPISVGARLLDAGHLHLLRAAADFDLLRIGALRISLAVPGSNARRCILCGSQDQILPHLLAACTSTEDARVVFLATVDASLAVALRAAPQGDWPAVVLSPSQGQTCLVAAVEYCAKLVLMLKAVP